MQFPQCAVSNPIAMGVGCVLRVSWICLLLFSGSLAFPSIKGSDYQSKRDYFIIGGNEDDQLETSPTVMLAADGQAEGFADRSYQVSLAAAPKRSLLTPNEGARNQGGRAVEFGQENAKMEDWERVEPVTFPLSPPDQHDDGFEEQLGSRRPRFTSADVSYEPSTTFDLDSDLIPPTPYQLTNAHASSSDPALEADQVSSSGGDFDPSQNLNSQFAEQDGIQSHPLNLVYEDVFQFPSDDTAQLLSNEGDPSNYDSVNVVQPRTWYSAPYMTREEEPVFGAAWAPNWARAAPVETPAHPSSVADLASACTPSKATAEPVRIKPVIKDPPKLPSTQRLAMPQAVSQPFPSTYIVQSKGGSRRRSKVYTRINYSSGFPPLPPFVHEG